MVYIGIDPGTHTGVAVWDSKEKKFLDIETFPIHKALELVKVWSEWDEGCHVIVEDARQRRWFGKESSAKIQGVGSVKRDCAIWEDFLKDNKITHELVHPLKGGTKLTSQYFKTITGWEGRTSEHARDASMLVIGR